MKRTVALGTAMVLCVGLLSGCGTDYNTTEDTVFLLKNGKVVSTDVESFDSDAYSKDELESYIDQAVSAYNSDHGKDSVEKKKLLVKDGTAVLTLEYASVQDYAAFCGTELFGGSVAEALAAGYTFDTTFASVNGDKITYCDASEVMGKDGAKVAVIKGDVNLNVAGNILYASTPNAKLIDKKTLGFSEGNDLVAGETVDTTEAVESEEETEVAVVEDIPEDSGSVSEDEMDLGSDEPEVVTFDFGETAEEKATEQVVYTYVVYK